MKAGALKGVASAYGSHFTAPWKRVKNEFMRRIGVWVQIVSFNPSRFDDSYVPKACFEFLHMPGPATGAFLVQELFARPKVQRWVFLKEHEKSIDGIFSEMVRQFRPSIVEPVSDEDIVSELRKKENYWPHVYALSVLAAERGSREEAMRYLDVFRTLNREKPFDWVKEREQELVHDLSLVGTPAVLRTQLQIIEKKKLRDLGLESAAAVAKGR